MLLALLVLAASAQPFVSPYETTPASCATRGITVCSFYLTNPAGDAQGSVTSLNVTTTFVATPPANTISVFQSGSREGPVNQTDECNTWVSGGGTNTSSNNVQLLVYNSINASVDRYVWFPAVKIAPNTVYNVMQLGYTGSGYVTQTWHLIFT